MRNSSLTMVLVLAGCGAPVGEMLDTDGSSSSGSSSGDVSATSPTTTASTTMSTSATTSPTTTSPSTSATTVDPDTSTTEDPTDTDPSTGECPPGDLGCPCDVGSTCNGDLLCEGGTCVAEPACDEPEGEPNDDEASAVELAEAACGADAMTVQGGFDGAESDWFRYHAVDDFLCTADPDAVVTADVDVAVCLYIDCDNGQANVNCTGGADEDTSPDGLDGCCDQGEVGLGFFGCGVSPTATFLVRLTSIDAACTPYELAFDY